MDLTRLQYDEAVRAVLANPDFKGKFSRQTLITAELVGRKLFGPRTPEEPLIEDYEVEWRSEMFGSLAAASEPLRGITKLESGCAYAVAVPMHTSPHRLTEFAEILAQSLREKGINIKFVLVPSAGDYARLDELEAELARVKTFVGGPS